MTTRKTTPHSYTRAHPQGKLYVLRLNGFWGTLITIAVLLLLLPLVIAFFLFFLAGFVALALIGSGYAWWQMRKFRRMHSPHEEDTIELAASEYHALEEPREQRRDAAGEK